MDSLALLRRTSVRRLMRVRRSAPEINALRGEGRSLRCSRRARLRPSARRDRRTTLLERARDGSRSTMQTRAKECSQTPPQEDSMSNVAIDTGRQWSCSICGNSAGNREHHAREMMFGTREVFSYQECGKCGCVQLVDEIGDLSRHYPADYYSFRALPRSRLRRLKHWLKAARARRILTGRSSLAGYLGSIVARGRSVIDDAWLQEAVRHGLQFGSRILDVGCGSGKTLVALQANGFRQLFGVDPFIPEDVRDGSSLWIRRSLLEDLRDDFDFIMFHHSFEHISEGESLLRAARDRRRSRRDDPRTNPDRWRIVGPLWSRLGAARCAASPLHPQ